MSMVSILIPVFNRYKYIAQTIECALAQSHPDIEIIVVDNHSTDTTWEIVSDYAHKDTRIRAFQNNSNIGPVRNWRRCIDEARGKYGKILWSDDLISPDFLTKTLPFIKGQDDVGFVFTETEIFNDDSGKRTNEYCIGKSGKYSTDIYIQGAVLDKCFPVSPGCALFRLKDLKKNLLIQVPNKASSDFSMHAIGNDVLIFLMTASQYPQFAFVNERLSYFRAHRDSISISSSTMKMSILYGLAKAFFLENHYDNVGLTKKFNAIIALTWIRNFRNTEGVKRLKDYYPNGSWNGIDMKFLIRKIAIYIRKLLVAFFNKKQT